IVNNINSQLQSVLTSVKQDVTSRLKSATSNLSATMASTLLDPQINNIAQGLPAGPLQSLVTKLLTPIKSLLTKAMDSFIGDALNSAINRIAGSVSDALKAGLNGLGQQIKDQIHSVLDPQIPRIQAKLTALAGEVSGELDPIFAQLQSLAGIQFGPNFTTVSGIQTNVTAIGIGNATAFIGMPSVKSANETEQQHLATMLNPPTGTALGDWLDAQGAIGLFVQNFTMGL